MTTAPLSSSAFFTPALFNLRDAQSALQDNTYRLSSGNRIINAIDDVASFSVAARLQSQLSSLKQVNMNIAQGSSLLQVAAGGLQQVNSLLDSLKNLSIQANSSALTNTERGYLQQQFASHLEQLDNLAGSTSFNNIKLLDGTLAGGNQILTQSSTATKASGSFTFTDNPGIGETVEINGVSFVADTDFTIGADAIATASNLATALNASTDFRISQASYQAVGASITVTAKAGGAVGNNFFIDGASSTADISVSGGSTVVADLVTLSGGLDNGLNAGSTKATGTVGDTLLTAQNQVAASVSLSISGTVTDGETLVLGDGNGGNLTFTFRNAAALSTDIQIGGSTEETLQNIVSSLSQYSASNDYGLRQLDYTIGAGTVTFKNKVTGNVNGVDGNAIAISDTLANGTLSVASFNNGADGGVNASGVAGSGFTGGISGFSASYVGADEIDASVTVGGNSYTARISDTTPGTDTRVRFSSQSGGYFDVQLASGQGSAVGNQTQADTYAARLNAAFSGLSFTQDKLVTNVTATGALLGSTVKLQQGSGSTPRINAVSVTAAASPGGDAGIDFTIGNSTYRNSALGQGIGAHETVRFTNTADPSRVLTFTNGDTAQDLSTANGAAAFEAALVEAFSIDAEGVGTDFQIGLETSDRLNVSIGSVSSFSLFAGETPNIGTQLDAQNAQGQIDTALEAVKSIISYVAGKQTSLDFAVANLQQSITAVEQAHSALADTDIVAESTDFALNTLKVNSSVAVIAQALSLPSGLLAVLRASGNS